MSEDRLQQECVMWFHNTYPRLRGCLFSVPNGGARSAREGKLLKQTGLYPGVADLLFMYQSRTLCLELKTEKGMQSDKQKAWQKTIKEQGFNYYIIRSLSLFQDVINSIVCN